MKIKVNNFLIQMQGAQQILAEQHERLIKAGFMWDGQDGYEAPQGFDMAKFYELTVKE